MKTTNCSVHERCIWELALEGAKSNAETAICRMEKAESRLAWAEELLPPTNPVADEEAALMYRGDSYKGNEKDPFKREAFADEGYIGFLEGCRHKEAQMRELIEAAVKSERQRISKAFCENSVNRGVFAEIPKEVFDDIINPVADDSGVE